MGKKTNGTTRFFSTNAGIAHWLPVVFKRKRVQTRVAELSNIPSKKRRARDEREIRNKMKFLVNEEGNAKVCMTKVCITVVSVILSRQWRRSEQLLRNSWLDKAKEQRFNRWSLARKTAVWLDGWIRMYAIDVKAVMEKICDNRVWLVVSELNGDGRKEGEGIQRAFYEHFGRMWSPASLEIELASRNIHCHVNRICYRKKQTDTCNTKKRSREKGKHETAKGKRKMWKKRLREGEEKNENKATILTSTRRIMKQERTSRRRIKETQALRSASTVQSELFKRRVQFTLG